MKTIDIASLPFISNKLVSSKIINVHDMTSNVSLGVIPMTYCHPGDLVILSYHSFILLFVYFIVFFFFLM